MPKKGFATLEISLTQKARAKFLTGFTLIEMIIVTAIAGFVILSFTAMSLFFVRQVNRSREHTNMYSQLDYTLSDMRLRCISAVTTTTPLESGRSITVDQNGGSFTFNAEENIHNITPDNLDDNVNYTYRVDDPGNPGSLVLNTTTPAGVVTSQVLIDARYHPSLVFAHHCPSEDDCDEPNFITVTLTLSEPINNITIDRTEGIRFWFLSVVQSVVQ